MMSRTNNGINTGKGFCGNVAFVTSGEVPIGSIIVSKGTSLYENFKIKEKTFYFTKGLIPCGYLYEDLEDVPSNAESTTEISGTFVMCGFFRDPTFEEGSGAVPYMKIWQRIA